MTFIQTVRGPISLEQLGETMMHEHVISEHRLEFKARTLAFARKELQKLVACGASSLVDCGGRPERHIEWYAELAPQINLNIIVVTGFYLEHLVREPERSLTEAQCEERFLRQVTEGIDGTNIRAGIIKVAGDKALLSPWEQKVMRAAARAQAQTGVPICTHACEGARSQFDLLVKSGADPERIYLSHIEAEFGWEGRTLKQEAQYLLAIAKEGGSLYFNNFMFEFDTPHEDTMYLMHTLCDKGYANRVLFGMDANFRFDDLGVYWEAERNYPITGVRTYSYTYTGAIPLMRRWGFTDEHFHQFLVENPKRLFSTTRV